MRVIASPSLLVSLTVYEDSLTRSGRTGQPNKCIYLLGYAASAEQQPYNGVKYDPLTVSTLLRWGNFDCATNETRWDMAEVPPGAGIPNTRKLPASLFLSSKPSWWGDLPWPAIFLLCSASRSCSSSISLA